MPVESNLKRAEYFPRSDLAASWYFDRAAAVINDWSEQDVATVNDAIEVYQCKLIAENYGEYLAVSEDSLNSVDSGLFGAACRFTSRLLQSECLAAIFDSIDLQYTKRLWEFLDFTNLWDKVSDESLRSLIDKFPYQIPSLLTYKQVVNQFDLAMAQAMKGNPSISAEAVIYAFAVEASASSHIFLPKSLTDGDLNEIMLAYLDCALPEVNLNLVHALASWPSVANDDFSPSPDVRVSARRRAKSLEEELFSDPEGGIRFGTKVQFSAEQIACKKVKFTDRIENRTFGIEWLKRYTDPPTVLNNLLYIFDIVGRDGILSCSSHPRTVSTLAKTFGLRMKDAYRMTFAAQAEYAALQGELFLYEDFLLKRDTRLEDAVEWFFNKYIECEFEVAGFSVSLPAENASWLDKCKAIGPEIERVLKAFKLYVQRGSIDAEYFEFTDVKDFGSIPSLLESKYLIAGEEFDRPANLLLNDQSRLAYTTTWHDGAGEFCRLIERNSLTESDFHEVCRPQLQYLIDDGYVTVGNDGTLKLSTRTHLIELVWKRGAALPSFFPGSSKLIEILVSEKVLAYSNTLLSPDEADYMSYLLNNAKFSNALALRNKYAHGSGVVSALTEKKMVSDYFMMLAALIGIVLKINEELSSRTGKGGLTTCDLIDWLLTE